MASVRIMTGLLLLLSAGAVTAEGDFRTKQAEPPVPVATVPESAEVRGSESSIVPPAGAEDPAALPQDRLPPGDGPRIGDAIESRDRPPE